MLTLSSLEPFALSCMLIVSVLCKLGKIGSRLFITHDMELQRH